MLVFFLIGRSHSLWPLSFSTAPCLVAVTAVFSTVLITRNVIAFNRYRALLPFIICPGGFVVFCHVRNYNFLSLIFFTIIFLYIISVIFIFMQLLYNCHAPTSSPQPNRFLKIKNAKFQLCLVIRRHATHSYNF
jgi:hypothetical protein